MSERCRRCCTVRVVSEILVADVNALLPRLRGGEFFGVELTPVIVATLQGQSLRTAQSLSLAGQLHNSDYIAAGILQKSWPKQKESSTERNLQRRRGKTLELSYTTHEAARYYATS